MTDYPGTSSAIARVTHKIARSAQAAGRTILSIGLPRSDSDMAAEAECYWSSPAGDGWRNNSHWRDGTVFSQTEWLEVGRDHLKLYERLARTAGEPSRFSRVIEWGCGGGANAVHFAPLADEFIAVDVSQASLKECRRQVGLTCKTPVVDVRVSLRHPEQSLDRIPKPCDLFLCLYVLELVPSKAYGLRILDIARATLREGGLGFVQIKYGSRDRFRRRRRYATGLASMTTYDIDEFWEAAAERGLDPCAASLVPRNDLDERYAYFLLQRVR